MPQSVDLSDLAQPPNSDPKRLKDVLAGVIPGARPTSEERSPAHNRQVGGVADSRHLTGDAIDFNPPAGMTRAQAVAAIRKADPHAAELLDEGTHIHWAPGIKHVDLSDISAGHVDLSDLTKPAAPRSARQTQPAPAQPAAPEGPMHRRAHEALEDLRQMGREPPHIDQGSQMLAGAREAGDLLGVLLSPVGGAVESAARKLPQQALAYGELGVMAPKVGGKFDPSRLAGDVAEMAVPLPGLPEVKAGLRGEEGAVMAGRDAAKAVHSLISPETTETGRPTAQTIRRSAGSHQLLADQTERQLIPFTRQVDRMSEPDKLALIDHIEHRSDPGRLIPPKQRPIVDAIGTAMDRYKSRIEYVMGKTDEGGPSFIGDYYSHLWQQKPEEVEKAYQGWVGRQGSGRSLKRRSIPTIQDGIDMGLTPVTTNPLEATSLYAQNMSRFLTTHDVLNQLKEQGITKLAFPGKQPDGWVPLEGVGTKKQALVSESGQLVPERRVYAPPDAAAVYNSWAGKGFEGGKYAGAYRGARAFANSATMLKLGLSAYHASTITVEAAASAVARALTDVSRIPGKLVRGDVAGAGRAALGAAKGAATYPAGFAKAFTRGRRLEQEVLGLKAPDSLSAKVNQAWERSGSRLRMDPIYRARASGSFYNAFKRGTFKTALMDAGKKLYTGSAWERAKGTLDLVGNVIQTVSAPLFEDFIPNVKRGAFAESMADWLTHNPGATQDEIDRMAIKLSDSMDNRFGEMVQDHIFWDRSLKQALQMALLSPSWNIGTVRELAGGLVDIPASLKGIATGQGLSPRTAYVAGLAFTVATANAVMTYLMTGKPPKSMQDLEAAPTGGTVETGAGRHTYSYPERIAIPGNQKDVYAFVKAVSEGSPGLIGEAEGKVNPAVSSSLHLRTNQDWRGDPEYVPPGVPSQPGDPTLAGSVASEMGPITFEMLQQRKRGTGIPLWATVLGARPSPEYVAAPDIYKEQRIARERKRLDQRAKHEETARERAAQ